MTIKILFACVGNAFRSQIAHAYARHLADAQRVEVRSGGTHPAGFVHPAVAGLLREVGVDATGLHSKAIDLEFADAADAFVSLCGPVDNACPAGIAAKAIVWDVFDPSWSELEKQREVRDLIGVNVRQLLAQHGALARR